MLKAVSVTLVLVVAVNVFAQGPATRPVPADERPIEEVNYDHNLLSDVVQNVADMTGEPIVIDWSNLSASGVTRDAVVSGRYRQTTATKVLTGVFTSAAGDKPKPEVATVDGIRVVAMPDRMKDLKARVAAHTVADQMPGKPDLNDDGEDVRNPIDRRLPDIKFTSNELTDVVDFLSDVSGVKIDADWTGLASGGIAKDAPVSLRIRNVHFGTTLTLVLWNLSTPKTTVDYKFAAGKLHVTAEAVKP